MTEVARRAGASRLCQVNLRIGVMREVVPEAMDLAWEVLCEEDPLTDGCKLTVEDVYPESVCNACGERFTHDRFHLRCPVCGSADTRLIHGRELDIISIEVEHPRRAQPTVTAPHRPLQQAGITPSSQLQP